MDVNVSPLIGSEIAEVAVVCADTRDLRKRDDRDVGLLCHLGTGGAYAVTIEEVQEKQHVLAMKRVILHIILQLFCTRLELDLLLLKALLLGCRPDDLPCIMSALCYYHTLMGCSIDVSVDREHPENEPSRKPASPCGRAPYVLDGGEP